MDFRVQLDAEKSVYDAPIQRFPFSWWVRVRFRKINCVGSTGRINTPRRPGGLRQQPCFDHRCVARVEKLCLWMPSRSASSRIRGSISLSFATPPDAKAALRWLMNRQPALWRDRQEVNVTGSLEQRLSQMTPEERARDAFEFAEQVRARLAELRGTTIEHEPKQ